MGDNSIICFIVCASVRLAANSHFSWFILALGKTDSYTLSTSANNIYSEQSASKFKKKNTAMAQT